MPLIKVREDESLENALRRFKRKCEKSGILSELSFDVQPGTFKAYIQPARPIAINGAWTIAVPSVEWWQTFQPSVKRIYRKLTGETTDFIFVQDAAP